MKRTYWIYRNQDCGFNFNKMPIYFERVSEQGNFDNGQVYFHSQSQYDKIWGPDAKFEVFWEKDNRITYHHAKKVNESIDMYNAINIAVIKKKTEWINSHEMTYWYGTRKQIKQKRFYASSAIHSVMLCDQTDRVFQIHTEIITDLFPNYEKLILEAMKSIKCHGS